MAMSSKRRRATSPCSSVSGGGDFDDASSSTRLKLADFMPYTPPQSTPKVKGMSKKEGAKRKINMSGYILFSSEMRAVIKVRHPDLSFGELSRLVGTEWRNLEAPRKAEYEERAAKAVEQQQQASPRAGTPVGGATVPRAGILVSVKTRADHKVHKLKDCIDHLIQRVDELQECKVKMEEENYKLRALLRQNNIQY